MTDPGQEYNGDLPSFDIRNEANGLTNELFYRTGDASDIKMSDAEHVRDVIERGLREAFEAGANLHMRTETAGGRIGFSDDAWWDGV